MSSLLRKLQLSDRRALAAAAANLRPVAGSGRAGRGAPGVLLLPEVLGKPLRDGSTAEIRALAGLLARLDLRPVDRATAELATALSSRYGLPATDATHLATAVGMGAERFITNNRSDFGPGIKEIEVTYLDALPDPASRCPARETAFPRKRDSCCAWHIGGQCD